MQIRYVFFSFIVIIAPELRAHHGVVGQFDLSKTLFLDGRITDIDFVNPHSYLYLDVVAADGTTESWNCELRGATALRRSGWGREMFAIGTRVVIEASPDWREPNTCYALTFEFPAENLSLERYQQLEVGSEPAPRAARTAWGTPNIAGDWAAPQFIPLGSEEAGIIRPPNPGEVPDFEAFFREGGVLQAQGRLNGQLTAQGEQLAATYDPATAAHYRCEATNILSDLIFDWYVNRIIQTEDQVEIIYGNSGQRRTIHIGQEFPANIEPTRFGYSIGRWDGDELVVQSRGFLPGVLHAIPIPELGEMFPPGVIMHSAELEIEEHFMLDAENSALRRQYRATDPVAFTGSYEGNDVMYPSEVEYLNDTCDPTTSRLPDGTRIAQ